MKMLRPPWLLVLAVLALHLLLAHEVQRIQQGWVSEGMSAMPARMRVEFVQEMALQTPPPVRAVSPPPPPKRAAKPEAAPAVAQVASGPASAPEPSLATEPVAEAASSPSVPTDVALPAVSAALDTPADEPGPEWPLSTRLSYELTGNYRGPVSGQAQVEWLRQGIDYQIHLDVGVGPSFAPLITRRMSSQGVLTPDGIAPRRYDEETKLIFGDPRRLSLSFLDAQRSAQDSVSQFVQLTWLFLTGRELLQVGHVVQIPLRLPSGPIDCQYEVVAEEVLYTPMGPITAWHLAPRQPPRPGDLAAEVWLAPSLQYLPVRLVIRQNADTHLDLMLKRAPLQAAPESSNGIPRRLSQ